MFDIHTKYVLWLLTNITSEDDKLEYFSESHHVVKSQTMAFNTENNLFSTDLF